MCLIEVQGHYGSSRLCGGSNSREQLGRAKIQNDLLIEADTAQRCQLLKTSMQYLSHPQIFQDDQKIKKKTTEETGPPT